MKETNSLAKKCVHLSLLSGKLYNNYDKVSPYGKLICAMLKYYSNNPYTPYICIKFLRKETVDKLKSEGFYIYKNRETFIISPIAIRDNAFPVAIPSFNDDILDYGGKIFVEQYRKDFNLI